MENKLDGKYKFTPPSVGSGDGVQWNGVSFDRWHLWWLCHQMGMTAIQSY